MKLTLQISDPVFTAAGQLNSLKLTVTVRPDPLAQRAITEIVPLPTLATHLAGYAEQGEAGST